MFARREKTKALKMKSCYKMHFNAFTSVVPILVIVYLVEIAFSKSCLGIVVEEKEANTTVTARMATNSTARNQQNAINPI